MKIYNTLTKSIDEFVSNEPGKVKMYSCGPTVYHYAHIGNLRSYIMQDVLEKSFTYSGYEVTRVMNVTDVGHLSSDGDTGDDKMVKSAKAAHKTVLEIAKMYTDAFFTDFQELNNEMPDVIAPATEHIDDYIKLIEGLIEKDYAYKAGDNIYFDISKLDNYYALTNQTEDELMVGVRDDVIMDEDKRNQADFVLWFTKSKFDNQDLKWDSPFGVGYPGWHIECSAIAIKYFGEYLDVHCGGIDNIFPHHTNEIAQSEAYIGHKWCNYWMHNGHLVLTDGKMSKSKGDFLTLSVLKEKGYNPLSYRYFCLNSHYRNPLVFSYESLDSADNAYKKLKSKINSLDADGEIDEDVVLLYNNKFKSSIDNDLNTSMMITTLYDLLKEVANGATKRFLIDKFDKVLSLDLLVYEKEEIPSEILDLVEERKVAKINKDFARADDIRIKIESLGYQIKDTREGTVISKEV